MTRKDGRRWRPGMLCGVCVYPRRSSNPTLQTASPLHSRKIQDILGTYVIIKGVVSRGVFAESKRPRMRAPQPRVAKDPKIRAQTRVHAIKRGTSKRRRPPATIYPRDQDCRGHVEQIRRRASYLVRRKHDGSKGWMETPEPRVVYRRWDDKNLD